MQINEFLYRYANTPINDRVKPINLKTNLNEIKQKIERLENEMLPKRIERDRLIRVAEEFFNQ